MFLAGLIQPYRGEVRGVQIDNGGEFKDAFHRAMCNHGLKQHYAWASCLDQNGKVERLNRTIREKSGFSAADLLTALADFLNQHPVPYGGPPFHVCIHAALLLGAALLNQCIQTRHITAGS